MQATLYTTNAAQNQFWAETPVEAGTEDFIHIVNVYPDIKGEPFDGFGGAFTEAAAYTWAQLPSEKQAQVISAYFADNGLRYHLGRVHLNSCDFALGNYAAVTDASDTQLQSFSIERDRQYILPMVQAALRVQPLKILASPWSPPAFMKTNGDMNHGGSLKPEYYGLWAQYLAKYLCVYRAEGLDVQMLSIQNEPAAVQTWDSCIYSAAEEGDFAANYLAPALKAAGLEDITIFVWDHNKENLIHRAKETMAVPGAAKAVGGFALHWYTGDHFETIRLAKQLYPDKAMYFTEGCVEYSRFADSGAVSKAEMYAHDILGNLEAGINGSIDWNLLLDAKGGPNHVGNFCEAPLMATEDGKDFEKRLSYYYIGQFSRYLQPGAVHIATSRYAHAVETTAFQNPDGTKAVFLLNRSADSLPVSLREAEGKSLHFTLAPHSMNTLLYTEI